MRLMATVYSVNELSKSQGLLLQLKRLGPNLGLAEMGQWTDEVGMAIAGECLNSMLRLQCLLTVEKGVDLSLWVHWRE